MRQTTTTLISENTTCVSKPTIHPPIHPSSSPMTSSTASSLSIFLPCPSEFFALLPSLALLRAAVSKLLVAWPENDVLARILDVAEKLARLPESAPLKRVMTGLEALLGRIDEWEMVASRDVTLGEEVKPLSQLVKKWRSLELASWGSILSTREQDAVKDVNRWWFRLFEIVNNQVPQSRPTWDWVLSASPSSSSSSSLLDKQAGITQQTSQAMSAEVFATLDQFLRTSTLGDFDRRAQLLRALGGYCHQQGRLGHAYLLIHLSSLLQSPARLLSRCLSTQFKTDRD